MEENKLDYGTGIAVGSDISIYIIGFTNSASISEDGGFPATNRVRIAS